MPPAVLVNSDFELATASGLTPRRVRSRRRSSRSAAPEVMPQQAGRWAGLYALVFTPFTSRTAMKSGTLERKKGRLAWAALLAPAAGPISGPNRNRDCHEPLLPTRMSRQRRRRKRPFRGWPRTDVPKILTRDEGQLNTVRWGAVLGPRCNGNQQGRPANFSPRPCDRAAIRELKLLHCGG
jgi:hypothetical protein